jgi:hypothetical protein
MAFAGDQRVRIPCVLRRAIGMIYQHLSRVQRRDPGEPQNGN